MPKIIEGVREKILENAKRRLFEMGYLHLSLREVARESGIATGTIYNYFADKAELIANIMLADWLNALAKMDACVQKAPGVAEGVRDICSAAEDYYAIYASIWQQPSVAATAVADNKGRHTMLCRQLADRVEKLIRRQGCPEENRYSLLIAEMILAAIGQEEVKKQLEEVVKKLYPKN